MGRKKATEYWKQVTELENGIWKCNRCGHEFSGGATRIRLHVDQIPGKGIEVCSVDRGGGGGGGLHNNIVPSGSTNPPPIIHVAANSLQGLVHNGIESSNVIGAFKEEINHLNQIISDLQCDEDDIKGQLQLLESRGKKRKTRVDDWLREIEGFRRRAGDMTQSPSLSGLKELTNKGEHHREEKPLVLSNEIVGNDFEQNFKKVWELLKDDQVFIIGIYGMAGMGKTLLASHVEAEIRRKRTFMEVFWVTVSQNFSISKLQHDIAKRISVKLDDEDNERTRATILSSALETKGKSVLILDDVWKYIDLQKVGIPLWVNGMKVILTTRLKHVCQQMDCAPHSMIKMEPLDYEDTREDWELFLVKFGHKGTPVILSSEIENIARSSVKMCEGLPLAINVMARTMKGKLNNIGWWKHTLNRLEKGEMGEEMEEEVFEVLKLSYDNLMDKDIQNCFLYWALLPADPSTIELIMKFVDKGLINGKRSLEEIFDEGSTVLDKLKAHSFIHSSLILRFLACYIFRKSHRYAMFSYRKGLPRLHEWTFNLEIVSLLGHSVEEIPEEMSPCCPKLSTFILLYTKIRSIPECFFIHMNALTVLDLSGNEKLTALPNSLSSLRSLVSLVLKGCESLEYVPPLGELQALSRLVISCSSIKQVPQGLETLISLKWLDLSRNSNLTYLVSGESLISGWTNMQYLDFCYSCIQVTAQDIQGMNMLEYFGGTFLNTDTYNQFVQNTLNNGFRPKHFFITFGNIQHFYCEYQVKGKIVCFDNFEEFGYLLLPRAFEELYIWNSNQCTCLCNGLSSEGSSSSSWKINICSCKKLKSLFCCSADSCLLYKSSSHHYSTLDTIEVQSCPSMKEIFANAPQSLSCSFSGLKHIHIYECHAIEYLLTAEIVPQLRNLETIEVMFCRSIKQVCAYDDDDDDGDSIIELPKLTNLELSHLPELMRLVCKGNIECESSKPSSILQIEHCPKLERDPLIKGCSNYFDSESNC